MRAGTEIHFSLRNSLEHDTLTFDVPARIADATKRSVLASVVLAPLVRGELRIEVRPFRPGDSSCGFRFE